MLFPEESEPVVSHGRRERPSSQNTSNDERRRASVNRANNDRWTQARLRRRELQDALVAEEARMRNIQQSQPSQSQFCFDIHELACLIFFCYDGVGNTSESGGRSRNREGASSRMDVDSEDEVEVLFNTMSNSVTFDPPEAMEVDPVEHGTATSNAPPLDTTSRTVVCPPAPQRRNPIPLPSSSSDQQQQQRRSAATAPHRVIDLDAYHDGPFRGALARAVEASRQTEQRRQHRQIEEEPLNRDRSNPAPTTTNRSQSRQSNRTDTARAQVSRTTYAIL